MKLRSFLKLTSLAAVPIPKAAAAIIPAPPVFTEPLYAGSAICLQGRKLMSAWSGPMCIHGFMGKPEEAKAYAKRLIDDLLTKAPEGYRLEDTRWTNILNIDESSPLYNPDGCVGRFHVMISVPCEPDDPGALPMQIPLWGNPKDALK